MPVTVRPTAAGEGGCPFEPGRVRDGNLVLRSRFGSPTRWSLEIPVIRSNGFHVLRHTFASTLLDGGVSIRGVAAYLGHSDPAFTLRVYAHLTSVCGCSLHG